MKIELVTEFTKEETDYLWSVGVDLDDWNFAIIGEPDILEERPHWETGKPELRPTEFALERILESGGYDYTCYSVDFREKRCAICVQYH
jgi:hypothetical protein